MKKVLVSLVFYVSMFSGLFAQSISESPEELFKWGLPMEVNGVEVVSTKPANGYVVLQTGERLEGLLKLKKSNNEITQIQLKAKKKKKFEPNQVSKYGLSIKMSDLNKNGGKGFNDEGKNFTESKITFKDGNEKSGYLAFQSNRKLFEGKPSGAKDFYVGFYFTPTKDGYLTSYPIADIKKITHGEKEYFPINGGFVSTEGGGNSKIIVFQKGTLMLNNEESLSGEIRQKLVFTKWYADSIYVKTHEDEMKIFGPDSVKSFTQMIDGEERVFMNIQNVFVEKLFDGNNYLLYRNPFPSENKILSAIAKSATIVGADQVATQKARNQYKRDVKNDKDIGDLADSYSEAKKTQLETFKQGVDMSNDISIKKKEYVVRLKSTGEVLILGKNKYKKWLKEQASACSNSNSEALKLYSSDISQIVEAIKIIDICK
ncbi:MAG: hypothetical protein AAGC43_01990 [Bacteroidota bacterium]